MSLKDKLKDGNRLVVVHQDAENSQERSRVKEVEEHKINIMVTLVIT